MAGFGRPRSAKWFASKCDRASFRCSNTGADGRDLMHDMMIRITLLVTCICKRRHRDDAGRMMAKFWIISCSVKYLSASSSGVYFLPARMMSSLNAMFDPCKRDAIGNVSRETTRLDERRRATDIKAMSMSMGLFCVLDMYIFAKLNGEPSENLI